MRMSRIAVVKRENSGVFGGVFIREIVNPHFRERVFYARLIA